MDSAWASGLCPDFMCSWLPTFIILISTPTGWQHPGHLLTMDKELNEWVPNCWIRGKRETETCTTVVPLFQTSSETIPKFCRYFFLLLPTSSYFFLLLPATSFLYPATVSTSSDHAMLSHGRCHASNFGRRRAPGGCCARANSCPQQW